MEFGARNRVVPSESHVITPYVTDFLSAEEVGASTRHRRRALGCTDLLGEGDPGP